MDEEETKCLVALKKDVEWMREAIKRIERRVDNEIPHQIGEISKRCEDLGDKIDEAKLTNSKWLIGILITLIFNLIGVIIALTIK